MSNNIGNIHLRLISIIHKTRKGLRRNTRYKKGLSIGIVMAGYKTKDCRLQHKALCTLLCLPLLSLCCSCVRRRARCPFCCYVPVVRRRCCALVVAPSSSCCRRCCFRLAVVFRTFVSCAASEMLLQHHCGHHQQIQLRSNSKTNSTERSLFRSNLSIKRCELWMFHSPMF